MSLILHMVLQQEPDQALNRGCGMGHFPEAIGVIREQIGVAIAVRSALGGRRIEPARKDLVQLNGHPGQSQPHESGVLIPTLLNTSEIPALSHDTFTANPVADLDRAAFLKLSLKDQLASTAAPLAMQLEPTPADRAVREEYRSPDRGGAMMQNASSQHQRGRFTKRGDGGGKWTWPKHSLASFTSEVIAKNSGRPLKISVSLTLVYGAERSIAGWLACTTSV